MAESAGTLARDLTSFAAQLAYDRLPVVVVAAAERVLLDSVGVALAGADMPWSAAMYRTGMRLGGGPEATLCGFGDRVGMAVAALVNGTVGHANDFDEYYAYGPLHPGSAVWTALAVGEATNVPGQEVLTSIVLGYEVTVRIAEGFFATSLGERGLSARGFQAQALCGVFAAALQAGRLLGLSTDQLVHAVGIAASYPGGTIEFLQDGSDVKRLLPGKACQQGIESALLAAEGFRGPASALEGRRGFFQAYGSETNARAVREGLGDRYAILTSVFKPYPIMGGNTAAVDGLLALRAAHALVPEAVRRIRARVRTHFVPYAGDFFGDTAGPHRPLTRFAAEMSLPYVLGVALVHGRLDFDAFGDDVRTDPRVLEAAARVEVVGDSELDRRSRFEAFTACSLEVETTAGEMLTVRPDYPRGDPRDPLSDAELEGKFRACAERRLPREQVTELLAALRGLRTAPNVRVLMDLTAPDVAARRATKREGGR